MLSLVGISRNSYLYGTEGYILQNCRKFQFILYGPRPTNAAMSVSHFGSIVRMMYSGIEIKVPYYSTRVYCRVHTVYNTTNNFTCIYYNIASGQQQQYSNVRVGQSVNSNKKKYKKQVSGLRTRILCCAAQNHCSAGTQEQNTNNYSRFTFDYFKRFFSFKFNRMNPGKYSMNFDAFCHALEPIFRPRLLFTF